MIICDKCKKDCTDKYVMQFKDKTIICEDCRKELEKLIDKFLKGGKNKHGNN